MRPFAAVKSTILDAQFSFEIVEHYATHIDDSYSFSLQPFQYYTDVTAANHGFVKSVGGGWFAQLAVINCYNAHVTHILFAHQMRPVCNRSSPVACRPY